MAVSALKDNDKEYSPSAVLWPGIEKTDAYLRQLDFRAKKSLGQNFMVQEKVLDKIVHYADIQEGDTVLEIGSGTVSLHLFFGHFSVKNVRQLQSCFQF